MADTALACQPLEKTCQACEHFKRKSYGIGGVCTAQSPRYSMALDYGIYERKSPESPQCSVAVSGLRSRVMITVEVGFDPVASDATGMPRMAYKDFEILARVGHEQQEVAKAVSSRFSGNPYYRFSIDPAN